MAGGAKKTLKQFIQDIPDKSLEAPPVNPGTIYTDVNFRLDFQGMTKNSEAYNLQIQVNKGTVISTLKKFAPQTVAGPVLVPAGEAWSPEGIRAKFLANTLI